MSKSTLPWLILVGLLTFFSFKSLLRPGYFPMHDDMQAMRVLQMDKCFRDGQFPCRWVPDMGYGYGYPQFIYYSPLPYYVMEIFHLLGLSFLDSVKAGIALSFILSALAMFALGKSLWGNWGGLVAALFYVYAPYRASDAYTRGAVGEFWALVFLPLIFWAIWEYVKNEKFKYLAFLALALAGLLTTHNITSVAFTPLACLWALFSLWYFKKPKAFLKLLLGGIWGIGLSAFFVFPVVFERQFVHVETMISGYFNYLAHFVSFRQLFFSTHWGYGSSELGPNDDLSFNFGILHWLFSLMALITAFFVARKEKIFKVVIFLALAGLAAVFMTHQRSVFIWNSLPFLAYFQFPWRFLTIATFAFSLLPGALIFFLKDKSRAAVLGAVMVVGVIFFNAFYFNPRLWYPISDKEKFSGELWEKQLTISIFDYLPIYAQAPPSQKAPDEPQIIKGKARVVNFQKGTDWQKGELAVDKEAEVRLPLYDFPGFKVWVDGQEIKTNHDNPLGLITFSVPAGGHSFSVKLTRTPGRLLGDLTSFLSFLFLGGWLVYEKLKH